MPARGGGYAVLKWVTSFPRNPERGLPTVGGIVLLSDAADGRLLAQLDAGALTALRTGAAAVLAAETLAAGDGPAAVIGCGVNGRAVARTFLARDRQVVLWDVDRERAQRLAEELGTGGLVPREEAFGADVVATVTPGREVLLPPGSLRAGPARLPHGSRRARQGRDRRRGVPALARRRGRVGAGEPQRRRLPRGRGRRRSARDDVSELGRILLGEEPGRASGDEITVFDSTGLAVQDLAVAAAVYERWREDPQAEAFAGVVAVELS